jgi:hypothetical protein
MLHLRRACVCLLQHSTSPCRPRRRDAAAHLLRRVLAPVALSLPLAATGDPAKRIDARGGAARAAGAGAAEDAPARGRDDAGEVVVALSDPPAAAPVRRMCAHVVGRASDSPTGEGRALEWADNHSGSCELRSEAV